MSSPASQVGCGIKTEPPPPPPPKYWTSVWQELISACMFDINPAALGNDRKQCLHNSVTKLVLRSFVCQWLLVPQSFVSPGQCTNRLAHCSSCTQMDHVPATFAWSVWLHAGFPLLSPGGALVATQVMVFSV